MKIDDLMISPGADIYYSKDFRDTLEAHMAFFRSSGKTQVVNVDSHKATVYEGDLFGYLQEIGIVPHLHWITMRANNFFTPYEFGVETESLLIPYSGDIKSITMSQKATGSIAV